PKSGRFGVGVGACCTRAIVKAMKPARRSSIRRLYAPSVTGDLVDDVEEIASGFETAQILREQRDERRPVVLHRPGRVRRDDDVRQIPVWARRGQRLLAEDVEGRAAKASVAQ